MKTFLIKSAAVALLTVYGSVAAAERFVLETKAYVFSGPDFRKIELPDAPASHGNHHVVFASPATVRFGSETLSLEGARFAWKGGDGSLRGLRSIATPVAVLPTGESVTLRSTAPVQYIEKAKDGSLQVREIPKDSPDAPRYALTFAVERSEGLTLRGEVNVTTFSNREPVSGLALNVGKPVLASFHETFDARVNEGEWSAVLVQGSGGGDLRLLLLTKLAAEPDRLMTAGELDRFLTYYYREPRLDLVGRAIESLSPTHFLENRSRAFVCVGFFAMLFAEHPERIGEWREIVERRGQDRTTRLWLRKAMKLAEDGEIGATGASAYALGHVSWGRFFASGDPANLRLFIENLKFVEEPGSPFFGFGSDAALSLAYFAADHPLVRQALVEAKGDADLQTREWIDQVLTKEVETVVHAVKERSRLVRRIAGISPERDGALSGHSGPRDAGYFGPINPDREMGTQR